MASKSKRAQLAPQRDLKKTFMYWAVIVFLIKLEISSNIPAFNIEINGKPFLLDGIWLGADGENYLKGYDALSSDGVFSTESILSYWPAGYSLIILLLSLFSKGWVLTTLAIIQSLFFSFSAYFLASQLYKTRLKKYSYLVLIFILLNPTLSLSSLAVGYESLVASGFLIVVALIISDLVQEKNNLFFFYLVINASIIGVLSFMQPRMLIPGILINFLWLFTKIRGKIAIPLLIASITITLFFPATLIYRNSQAVGMKSISTNLGATMNIGAGDNANGGYMQKDYGVPCELSGSPADQDSQKVHCVLKWYINNPTKAANLFYKKSVYFWSPWTNNGFMGEVATGTMSRNPWQKINPIIKIASNPDGAKLVSGTIGHLVAWLWLFGGVSLMLYGYLLLYHQRSLERFIGNIAMIVIATNWLVSLLSIGDHRFRIPVMGMSLFLQAIGLRSLLKGRKVQLVDGPSLR